MTVKELIKKLKNLDPKLLVHATIHDSYENYCNTGKIVEIEIGNFGINLIGEGCENDS